MKVRFLTPYNVYEEMEYYEVLEYCKYIATLPMFKDDFEEFKKNYNHFSAYFDFVMFKLGYIMINPLGFDEQGAIADSNHIYFFRDKGDDYETIRCHLQNDSNSNYRFIMRITKVDDITLQIERQTTEIKRDALVDPNMISMMSKSSFYSSHLVSGNTILNQLLIASKEVVDDYYSSFIYTYEAAVEYLVNNMGFIRLVSPEYAPLMIVNRRVSTLRQKMFFDELKRKQHYQINDTNIKVKSGVALYRKVLKQTKKEL